MGSGLISIGLSGLNAAQAALTTTSHNIANVNTPGYSRQQVLQATSVPLFTGGGYLGQGVDVTTVRRVYSDFLSAQAVRTQGNAAQVDAYSGQLAQLDNLFGDNATSLAPALSGFFAGVNAVAANPADAPSRQTMLSSAAALVDRFHALDAQMTALQAGANSQVETAVGTINSLTTQIAALNQRVAAAQATSAQPPNDLLDQRNALVGQLAQQLGVTTVVQSDGALNVFSSSGQALVVGATASKLVAVASTTDPQNLQVAVQTGPSALLRLSTADVTGGLLGGVLAYRDGPLKGAQDALGRIASVLANDFNAQHLNGLDRNGNLGVNFFAAPRPVTTASSTNLGNATIGAQVANPNALTGSDYRLSFDGTNYTMTRLSDGTAQSFAALPQTVDGVVVSLNAGTINAGDSFLVQPTHYGARDIGVAISDPALIAAAVAVRTSAGTGNAGSGTVSGGTVTSTSPGVIGLLGGPLTLTYNAGAATLTIVPATLGVTVGGTTYAAGTPVPYTPGATLDFGGMSFAISGAPANGDTFTVALNTGGVGDGRNATLLAALADQSLVANGTATLGGAYGQLVAQVGNTTAEAGIERDAQDALLAQTTQAQQSLSGVNLDEEAANLQRYQQAYQAAGKVIAVASTLFDTILSIANR